MSVNVKHADVDASPGSGDSRGLLSHPVSGLGVLSLQEGAGFEKEAQCRPSGYSRVWGPAEEAGALRGCHHPVHRRPPPSGRVQTCAQGSWWEADMGRTYRLTGIFVTVSSDLHVLIIFYWLYVSRLYCHVKKRPFLCLSMLICWH